MRFLAIHNAALLYAIDSTGDNLAKTHTYGVSLTDGHTRFFDDQL